MQPGVLPVEGGPYDSLGFCCQLQRTGDGHYPDGKKYSLPRDLHRRLQKKGIPMSLAKVIEVIGEGKTMEGAVENAITEASKTVQNIRNIWVENIQGIVENNAITKYRVNAKITFVVDQKNKL